MQDAPGVLVGGVQYTPDDPLPSPIVAVTFSERSRAEEAAKTLMSLQNGVRPFQTGPVIYVGDTNIKVRVSPAGEKLLVQVYAYADPKHLTCAFYAAGRVEKSLYKAFRNLVAAHRTYTLTVAAGDDILMEELDLLKYILDEKEVKI
ncbi:MAG: hypothetical protein ACOX5M_08025 [Bacillota bacterium]|jgi:hypothetical protein